MPRLIEDDGGTDDSDVIHVQAEEGNVMSLVTQRALNSQMKINDTEE